MVARALRPWGYRVFYVQNVTNIDDRLIARGAESGPTRSSSPTGTSRTGGSRWRGSGVRSVNYYPYATDYMPEIIDQIETLVDRGFAYPAEGSVYYEVGKFPDYGKLSGQKAGRAAAR